jgi:hypothetical protein
MCERVFRRQKAAALTGSVRDARLELAETQLLPPRLRVDTAVSLDTATIS